MIDINGIITGALNPVNEGLTVRQALTTAINDVCILITSLANAHARDLDGNRSTVNRMIDALDVMDGTIEEWTTNKEQAEVLAGAATIFTAAAEEFIGNMFMATLTDCGVLSDLSNLDEVLTPVFGNATAQAHLNVTRSITMLMAMAQVFNVTFLSTICTQLTVLRDEIITVADAVKRI